VPPRTSGMDSRRTTWRFRQLAITRLSFLALVAVSASYAQTSPPLVGVLDVSDYLSYTGFALNTHLHSPCSEASFSVSGPGFPSVTKSQTGNTVAGSVDYYFTRGLTNSSPMTAYSTGSLTIYALGPTGTHVTLTGTRTGQTVVTSSGATVSASASGGHTASLPGGPSSVTINDNLFPNGGTFVTGAQTTCNGQPYSLVTSLELGTYLVVNNNCPGTTGGTAEAINTIRVKRRDRSADSSGMSVFSLVSLGLNLLGLLGFLFTLLCDGGEDPRFEGDKLIYRS
jgi:hypothetical protein